jgi:hypothetical protein
MLILILFEIDPILPWFIFLIAPQILQVIPAFGFALVLVWMLVMGVKMARNARTLRMDYWKESGPLEETRFLINPVSAANRYYVYLEGTHLQSNGYELSGPRSEANL